MTPTFTLNNREFNAVLRAIADQSSSRTFPETCNAKGLHAASAAIRHTKKADKERIAHEMGQIATIKPPRGGKIRWRHRVFRTDTESLAHRIINARLRAKGEDMVWGDELDARAKRMIGARLRAVAFIKSGWIYAVRELAKIVGYASAKVAKYSRSDTARMTGLPKGFTRPARRTMNGYTECVIGNSALIHNHGAGPMGVAVAGLQMAMEEVRQDMLNHLNQGLLKLLSRYTRG